MAAPLAKQAPRWTRTGSWSGSKTATTPVGGQPWADSGMIGHIRTGRSSGILSMGPGAG